MSEKFKKSILLILSAIAIVFLAVIAGNFLVNDFVNLVNKVNSSVSLKSLVLVLFAVIVFVEVFKHFKKK